MKRIGMWMIALMLFGGHSVVAQAAPPLSAGTAASAKARFPQERAILDGPLGRHWYSNLGTRYDVLEPSDPTYNCVAHTLGHHDRWINPRMGPTRDPLASMNQLYAARRYSLAGTLASGTLDYRHEPGKQKIVVYAIVWRDRTIKEITHAALQMADGTWTSKLGKLALIRHRTPEDLDGPSYGVPVAVYVRARNASR